MAGTKTDAKAETSGGGGGAFSEKGLAEKLNKLNSSAASIQSILVSVCLFVYFLRACKLDSLACFCSLG